MKLIFLDIDGVLNRLGTENRTTTRWRGFIGMEPELVIRFNELCENTGAKVVLSSTWRLDPDWREVMKANGLRCEFIDRTPSDGNERGEEVDEWLCAFLKKETVEKYVIIDDDSDFYPTQPLFKTDYREGLTAERAVAIHEYLNS